MATEILQRQALEVIHSSDSAEKSECKSLACTSLGSSTQRGHEDKTGILATAQAEKAAEKRRKDRKEQYHSQVWTKAAHGGPYRKCDMSREVTAPADLGYERTASGPTTNFVGNHMTQGAIDLVQMELEEDNPAASYERLKTYCKLFCPPRKLQHVPPLALEGLSESGSGQDLSTAGLTIRETKSKIPAEDTAMQQVTLKHPAALRRALIRQREGKAPRDGLLFDQKQLMGLDPVQAGSLPLPAPALKEEPVLLEEVLDAANYKMLAGDYAGALQLLHSNYHVSETTAGESPMLALYFLQRARCCQQLGMLKEAVKDSTSCINASQKSIGSQQAAISPALSSSLLLRAQLHEQLEQFELSRQDYEGLSQVQPSNQHASRGLSRLRSIAAH